MFIKSALQAESANKWRPITLPAISVALRRKAEKILAIARVIAYKAVVK